MLQPHWRIRENQRASPFLSALKLSWSIQMPACGPRKEFNADKRGDEDGFTRIYSDQALIWGNIDRPEMTLAFRIG
jgi:hypothetical protein